MPGVTVTTMLRDLFMLDMLDMRDMLDIMLGATTSISLSLTQNTVINITNTMTREMNQMN